MDLLMKNIDQSTLRDIPHTAIPIDKLDDEIYISYLDSIEKDKKDRILKSLSETYEDLEYDGFLFIKLQNRGTLKIWKKKDNDSRYDFYFASLEYTFYGNGIESNKSKNYIFNIVMDYIHTYPVVEIVLQSNSIHRF